MHRLSDGGSLRAALTPHGPRSGDVTENCPRIRSMAGRDGANPLRDIGTHNQTHRRQPPPCPSGLLPHSVGLRKACPNGVLTARRTEGSNLLSSSTESVSPEAASLLGLP